MNYSDNISNKVNLTGKIISEPVYTHEVFGEGFYEMQVQVPRLSEHSDVLPVTISERIITDKNLTVGSEISVFGQFRSYNKIVDGKSRLMLTVFVRDMFDEIDRNANPNNIELSGYICKPPVYRTTPFKREICDLLIAVNRAYNKSDYIPCIAWGRNARFAKNVAVGQKVDISGRIQSREYQKKLDDENILTKIAYEISINKIVAGSGSELNIDMNLSDEGYDESVDGFGSDLNNKFWK